MRLILIILLAIIALGANPCHSETWKEQLDEAVTLYRARHTDSAFVVAQRALNATELKGDDSDSAQALVLHRLGSLHLTSRNHAMADSILQEALQIWRRLPGQRANMAKTIGNLGQLYIDQEKYSLAKEVLMESIDIKKSLLPKTEISLASSLHKLGQVYYAMGNYTDADRLLLDALKIRRRAPDPARAGTPITLNLLGISRFYQGRHEEAAELLLEAIELNRKSDSPESGIGYASTLPAVYNAMGEYSKAESLCVSLLDSLDHRGNLSIRDLEVKSRLLKNLGQSYGKSHRLELAVDCHLKDLAIVTDIYGPDHEEYAKTLFNIANTRVTQKRYEEADSLLRIALSSRQSNLGPRHPMTGWAQKFLAINCLHMGDFAEALINAEEAFDSHVKNFNDGAMFMSERNALRYSDNMRSAALVYLSCLLPALDTNQSLATKVSEIVLATKGSVSDEIFQRRQLVSMEADENFQKDLQWFYNLRSQAMDLEVQGTRDKDSSSHAAIMDSLLEEAAEIEDDLALRSVQFSDRSKHKEVTTEAISHALPPKSCLVEYDWSAYVHTEDGFGDAQYIALIYDSSGVRDLTVVENADTVDSLVREYRRHIDDVSSLRHMPLPEHMEEYSPLAKQLYFHVWKPLEPVLKDYETVFIATDGMLNLVSLAGLIDDNGRYLIENKTFHHVTSGRNLLNIDQNRTSSTKLLAIGDPDYNASVEQRIKAVGQQSSLKAISMCGTLPAIQRGSGSSCESLADVRFDRLINTRTEVEHLSSLWPQERDVLLLMGLGASEDNLKANAAGKRVIHLATHGFYLPVECSWDEKTKTEEPGAANEAKNPLIYSGLFLAGGNLHGAGSSEAGIEDGILTAEEVATLDLRDTDMVVLSACETGLGLITAGEDTYGLRRAFQMAGAKTVVSALWSVRDDLTAEMMTGLYRQDDQNLPERLRDIQLGKIAELRKLNVADHPLNWAGFIAIGDWR